MTFCSQYVAPFVWQDQYLEKLLLGSASETVTVGSLHNEYKVCKLKLVFKQIFKTKINNSQTYCLATKNKL